MGKKVSLLGRRYGRLQVIELSEKKGIRNRTYWKCQCDCGNVVEVAHDKLQSGDTKSCGCLKHESCIATIKAYNSLHLPNVNITHGYSGTRLYQAYCHMIERCYKTTVSNFKNYGGRGIRVCDEWRESPGAFIEWAINSGYRDDLTIDRIDVNGDYSPDNCKWSTNKQQANNKRTNVKAVVNGESLTLSEIASKYGFKRGTIWWRYKKGWRDNKLIKPLRRWNNESYA